jgi:hypothetical protein
MVPKPPVEEELRIRPRFRNASFKKHSAHWHAVYFKLDDIYKAQFIDNQCGYECLLPYSWAWAWGCLYGLFTGQGKVCILFHLIEMKNETNTFEEKG